ncbi:MAG: TA system VapC family ribonuclease toxin [Gemmatimonas sp.]|uniref:TA system VapC family ribonuclease toxin n=1 Tax=Gemmatimonas sp. TaxID=1962908 RepID=UPI0022BF11C8|nr:TA system VapC family ribonuclease toxin [Gemmatimonas sp.]MCZ8013672.1 PIN domain-containing protein [Gemmatimonas sp.]MCZ8267589.1 PIN domain-containing protein [Gemmatimonas sp.]
MQSLDTNILLYAINRDCAEHESCRTLVAEALDAPNDWVIADQLWFELYRLLRHPSVLQRPLDAATAANTVAWYRDKSGWQQCAWSPAQMPRLHAQWAQQDFPARRTFDAVLALTLRSNGVTRFYTRNVRDFAGAGFAAVVDPVNPKDQFV